MKKLVLAFAGAGILSAVIIAGVGFAAYKGMEFFGKGRSSGGAVIEMVGDRGVDGVFDPVVIEAAGKKDWAAAVLRLEELVTGDVGNEKLRHALGICLFNLAVAKMEDSGDEDALQEAGRRLERSALFLVNDEKMTIEVWRAYASLGILESDIGKSYQGRNRIVAANRKIPDDPYISYVLGATYVDEGNYKAALPLLRTGAGSKEVSTRDASAQLLAQIQGDASEEEKFSVKQVSGFVVRYDGEPRPELAEKVIGILRAEETRIRSVVGTVPATQVEIIMYTGQRFSKERGLPDWAGGLFDGRIRVGIGDAQSARLRSILAHEYAHAAVHGAGGRRVPIWMHEGIAQAVQYGSSPSVQSFQGLNSAGIPSLSSLNSSFLGLSSAEASAAYAVSYIAVSQIIGRYGSGAIPGILDDISRGVAPEAALRRVTGLSQAELDGLVAGFVRQ